MKVELKEWLNSINQTKENLLDETPEIFGEYPPYIINKCLSGFIDTILFSNEMNKSHHLDKKMQYDFYINIVRKRKRFSPWLKKEKIDDLEHVKRYYGYSNEKAKIALNLLTKEQLDFIRSKNDMGGKR